MMKLSPIPKKKNLKDYDINSSINESEIEKSVRRRIRLPKINKSYSTIPSKRMSRNIDRDNEESKVNKSFKFERIDYAKKIKEANEIRDLQRIYDRWLLNRGLRRDDDDDEYIMKLKINDIEGRRGRKVNPSGDFSNVRYKKLFDENQTKKSRDLKDSLLSSGKKKKKRNNLNYLTSKKLNDKDKDKNKWKLNYSNNSNDSLDKKHNNSGDKNVFSGKKRKNDNGKKMFKYNYYGKDFNDDENNMNNSLSDEEGKNGLNSNNSNSDENSKKKKNKKKKVKSNI